MRFVLTSPASPTRASTTRSSTYWANRLPGPVPSSFRRRSTLSPTVRAWAWTAICGKAPSPLCELGWKSLGVLELTALPSIQQRELVPMLRETDALLVWGGDVLYLCHGMRQSGRQTTCRR